MKFILPLKKFINMVLGLLDLELRKKKNRVLLFRNEKMISGLKRFRALDLPIGVIVDVGAAAGTWTIAAKEFWPQAKFILFEPLLERRSELETLVNNNPNFHFISKAVGKEKGKVPFVVSPDLDGSGISSSKGNQPSIRIVDVTSIPIELNNFGFQGPLMIKLDTHGFEIPILQGCESIIEEITLFIIECYGFQIADDSLLFWEMCRHMDEIGFRLFNIVDVMHRPLDGAFWQCDVFFIRKDSSVFQTNTYQ